MISNRFIKKMQQSTSLFLCLMMVCFGPTAPLGADQGSALGQQEQAELAVPAVAPVIAGSENQNLPPEEVPEEKFSEEDPLSSAELFSLEDKSSETENERETQHYEKSSVQEVIDTIEAQPGFAFATVIDSSSVVPSRLDELVLAAEKSGQETAVGVFDIYGHRTLVAFTSGDSNFVKFLTGTMEKFKNSGVTFVGLLHSQPHGDLDPSGYDMRSLKEFGGSAVEHFIAAVEDGKVVYSAYNRQGEVRKINSRDVSNTFRNAALHSGEAPYNEALARRILHEFVVSMDEINAVKRDPNAVIEKELEKFLADDPMLQLSVSGGTFSAPFNLATNSIVMAQATFQKSVNGGTAIFPKTSFNVTQNGNDITAVTITGLGSFQKDLGNGTTGLISNVDASGASTGTSEYGTQKTRADGTIEIGSKLSNTFANVAGQSEYGTQKTRADGTIEIGSKLSSTFTNVAGQSEYGTQKTRADGTIEIGSKLSSTFANVAGQSEYGTQKTRADGTIEIGSKLSSTFANVAGQSEYGTQKTRADGTIEIGSKLSNTFTNVAGQSEYGTQKARDGGTFIGSKLSATFVDIPGTSSYSFQEDFGPTKGVLMVPANANGVLDEANATVQRPFGTGTLTFPRSAFDLVKNGTDIIDIVFH